MAKPPALSLVAKALITARPSIEPSILAMALSQSIGEGSWSAWTEAGELLYPFDGTNNFGAIHATEGFAKAYVDGGSVSVPDGSGSFTSVQYASGWGMVAFLDHAPGPYITRMAVYPSLLAGADGFLSLIERYVSLSGVSSVTDYAAQLYVHNYFEGFHPNRTILANRAAVYQSGAWSDDDQANIADYAGLINGNLASAQHALAAAPSDSGDPSESPKDRTFASLGLRLTPSGRVYDHTGKLVGKGNRVGLHEQPLANALVDAEHILARQGCHQPRLGMGTSDCRRLETPSRPLVEPGESRPNGVPNRDGHPLAVRP